MRPFFKAPEQAEVRGQGNSWATPRRLADETSKKGVGAGSH